MTTLPIGRRPGATMTVVGHLTELRRRLIISILAVLGGAIVAFTLSTELISFLVDFYRDATDGQRDALIFTGPLDAFALRLKIAMYGGVILALPVWLWQLWRFVTPALDRREKRYAVPFIVASIAFFLIGAALALLTLTKALEFLIGVGGAEVEPLLAADKYVSLVSLMVVAFGVSFEFPILLMFLLLARVLSTDQLRRSRRWVAVGVIAFAAVITPSQDPYSLFALAVPMYVLFEGTIIAGRMLKR